ncbi:MAG: hypothetical protein Q4F83_13850 [Eubacteriales bacterium]|nr:hypothetical protein [Eubacteriales bacterium]
MKRGRLAAVVLCIICILTGCSGFSPEVTGVSINKKGRITQVVRENFDKDYYSKKEVESEISAGIKAYNESVGSKCVKKTGFSVKNDVAVLRMTYASAKDYADFNNIGFYLGDILGAVQAGYAFEGKFLEVSGGKVKETDPIWGSQIMSGKNYKTIVIEEAMLVEAPGDIKYVSENMKVTGKSTAVLEETGRAYILYE